MPWGVAAGAAIAAGGAYMQGESAKDAANSQANAQRQLSELQYQRATDAAGRVPEFRPVTVTSSFGTPQYTYDESGRLTGVGSTAAPWMAALQQQGQGYAGQYMGLQGGALQDQRLLDLAGQSYGAGANVYDLARGAAGQQAGLYGVGQELYGLSRGLAPTAAGMQATGAGLQGVGADIYSKAAAAMPTSFDTTQASQDYYNRMQQMVAPQREQQLAKTQQSLFNKGRQGLATGATQAGGMQATNPEMAAYYNAVAQQDLGLANQAEQQALSNLAQRTNMAQGLYQTGAGQYNLGLNYGQAGVGTTQAMGGLMGQGVGATQAGLGAGTNAAQLYGMGTGLFGAGGSLQNQYYTNLVAAQSPFTGQMSQLSSLENMVNQPVTQGMGYGTNVTNQANTIADAYMRAAGAGGQAAANAINSQYAADASNPWAGALIGAGQAIGGANWGSLFGSGNGGSGWGTTSRSVDTGYNPAMREMI